MGDQQTEAIPQRRKKAIVRSNRATLAALRVASFDGGDSVIATYGLVGSFALANERRQIRAVREEDGHEDTETSCP